MGLKKQKRVEVTLEMVSAVLGNPRARRLFTVALLASHSRRDWTMAQLVKLNNAVAGVADAFELTPDDVLQGCLEARTRHNAAQTEPA